MKIKDLTTTQIIDLQNEIILNSPFTSDYENTFNIQPQEVQDFFDQYLSYCEDCLVDESFDMIVNFARNDTNLTEYFNSIEWGD